MCLPLCHLKHPKGARGEISTKTKETTMAKDKLWQEIVDDYYREANSNLVIGV